jgi:membrane-associated phospholipid phosphatase
VWSIWTRDRVQRLKLKYRIFIPSQILNKFNITRRSLVILAVLACIIIFTPHKVEKYGDNLQIALPLAALGCEALVGSHKEFIGRYIIMFSGVHISKTLLGNNEINIRPNSGLKGFPSGHTATASFGAAAILKECVSKHWAMKTIVILAAGFTGASRIEAQKHNIWQVLFGALWGIGCALFTWGGMGKYSIYRAVKKIFLVPFTVFKEKIKK